jgi:hypothetical protein
MDSALARLVREQQITMAAAEMRSSSPEELRKLVQQRIEPVGVAA